MQFQSRPFLHFNTSISMWTLQFGSAWWEEADLFKADYNFCFNLETKSGLHFPWFSMRLLHISKPVTFKKVVISRSDSVPYNNGTSYWHCEFFYAFFISSTLYLKTCSLHCFTAKTVCKARIVLIPSKLINITCFSIISTIWACWKP